MGEGHVPFGVEVKNEILTRDHLFPDQHALSGVNPAELPWFEQASLHDQALRGEVFQDDEFVVSVRQQPLLRGEVLQCHVAACRIPEGKSL